MLAAPEESTKSLGTWPRCLFAPTYPLLLIAASLPLPLSLSSSLSHPLGDSSFSLRYIFQSLLSSRYLRLFTLLRLIFPIPAPTNKTLSLFLPLPSYLSSSRSIASSLSRLSFPHLILFFSGTFLLLLFIGLFTFYVSRLIFPIQHPLIKLYFASPYGFPETFWEIAFLSRGHMRWIVCFVRSLMSEARQLIKYRIIFLIRFLKKYLRIFLNLTGKNKTNWNLQKQFT